MTVSTTVFFTDWSAANGVIDNWSYDFNIGDETEVQVLVRDGEDDTTIQVFTDNFQLNKIGDGDEGFVVYPVAGAALAAGKQVRIRRIVQLLQTTEIGNEGDFRPQLHERTFDKLVKMIQQVNGSISSSIVVIGNNPGYSMGSVLTEGSVLIYKDGLIQSGPDGADIEDAQGYALEAGAARDLAQKWAENPEDVTVDGVGTYSALHYSAKASTAATLAEEWAENPEDDPVETGPDKFSAKHWAAKAEQIVLAGLIDGSVTTPKIEDGAVTTAKIGANQVTPDKQAGEHFRGLINGLTLSNNATDATNDIDIAAGSAGSDGATPVLMTLASALTKRLDANWAVGSGNGGLDTGSIANGTYHIWLIQRSDTGVVDALFSASATAPTMPANYDRKAYIAPVVRASGSLIGFAQVGRDTFVMNVAHVQVTETVGTAAASTTLVNCPTGINVLAEFSVTAFSSTANIPIWLSSLLASNDGVASGGRASLVTPGNIAWVAGQFRLVTNTSGQVRKKAAAAVSNFVTTFTGFTLLR